LYARRDKAPRRAWGVTSRSVSPAGPANLIVGMGFRAGKWVGAAHIPAMATIVQCNCGAEYRRAEEKFLTPHTGDAVCTVCGAALESWAETTHVPTYELIERPARKPE